jgi:hypothetical protein
MCAVADGLPGILVDPVSTVAGQNSAIAKINKTAVDPAGVLMRGDSLLTGNVDTKIIDPLNYGDGAREQKAGQAKLMQYYASQSGQQTAAKSESLGGSSSGSHI